MHGRLNGLKAQGMKKLDLHYVSHSGHFIAHMDISGLHEAPSNSIKMCVTHAQMLGLGLTIPHSHSLLFCQMSNFCFYADHKEQIMSISEAWYQPSWILLISSMKPFLYQLNIYQNYQYVNEKKAVEVSFLSYQKNPASTIHANMEKTIFWKKSCLTSLSSWDSFSFPFFV